MSFPLPDADDFKEYFFRDFPYGASLKDVTDADINKAIQDANVNFNQGFFPDADTFNVGFLNLAAHYMVMNFKASSRGLSDQMAWLEQSKSVDGVAQSFALPEQMMNHPMFAWYGKTTYGAKYLTFVWPQLIGQMFSVDGKTNA